MFCLFKMQFHILCIPSSYILYYNHFMFVIADKLKNILTSDIDYSEIETDFLCYGLDILLQDGLEYAGALTAGILMHRGPDAFCFLAVFGILRTCTGGLHASGRPGCFAGFSLIFILAMLAAALPVPEVFFCCTAVFSVCGILRNSPVIHPLCPLTIQETILCRRNTVIRCAVILFLIHAGLFLPSLRRLSAPCACGAAADYILMRLAPLFRKGEPL